MPLRQWIKSANFAIEGILHASKTQRHLRYHFCTATAVLLLSYALGITKTEFLFIALAVMAVLLAEMINTAIEYTVDLLSPDRSESARIAKDISAGAVLITAFGAALIGYIVLFPYAREVFEKGLYVTSHATDEIAALAVVIVLIAVILLKGFFGRGDPLSGGMPSGHSAVAFSVWVSVSYATRSFLASILSFVLAMLVAQSRVARKVHSPLEVVLGAMLGASLSFILYKLFS